MATINKLNIKGTEYDIMPAQFELKNHQLTITDSDGYSVTIPLSKPTTATTGSTGTTETTETSTTPVPTTKIHIYYSGSVDRDETITGTGSWEQVLREYPSVGDNRAFAIDNVGNTVFYDNHLLFKSSGMNVDDLVKPSDIIIPNGAYYVDDIHTTTPLPITSTSTYTTSSSTTSSTTTSSTTTTTPAP